MLAAGTIGFSLVLLAAWELRPESAELPATVTESVGTVPAREPGPPSVGAASTADTPAPGVDHAISRLAVPTSIGPMPEPAPGETLLAVLVPGGCLAGRAPTFSLEPRTLHPRSEPVAVRQAPIHDVTTVLRDLSPGRHDWILAAQDTPLVTGSIELGIGAHELVVPCDALPRVRVRVVGEDGRPVAGAHVSYSCENVLARGSDTTDSQGLVVFPGLPAHAQFTVQASGPGITSAHSPLLWFDADSRRHDIELVLPRDRSLRGLVLDPDGRPVPRADVVVDTEGALISTGTDADGRFELESLLLDAPLTVSVTAPGLAGTIVELGAPPADGEVLELRLTRGWTLTGHVRLADGRPYRGSGLQAKAEGAPPAAVEADREGAFIAGPFPTGVVTLTERSRPGFSVRVASPRALDLVLPERVPHRFDLLVHDEHGRPIRDPVTVAISEAGRGQGPIRHDPDPEGRIALSSLSVSGALDVTVSASGFAPARLSTGPLDPATAPTLPVTLRSEPPFELTVLDAEDVPVRDAVVTLRWPLDDGDGLATGTVRRGWAMLRDRHEVDERGLAAIDRWGRERVDYLVSAPGFLTAAGSLGVGGPRTRTVRLERLGLGP